MGSFLKVIKKIFQSGNGEETIPPKIDLDYQIELIKKMEANHPTEPGRRIHVFEYMGLNLSLDIEITNTYRLVVFMGQEKVYSFSIRCKLKDYDNLKNGIKEAIDFLTGERKVKNLPKSELVKGHYFGIPE